jgi:hypothetical protein
MHNAHLPVEQVTSIEHAHVREEMAVNMFTRGLTHNSPLCRSQIGSIRLSSALRGEGNRPLIQERRRDLEFRQRNRPLIQERRRDLEFRQRSRGLIFRREG